MTNTKTKTITITEQKLVEHFNYLKGATIIGFDLESEPKMRKNGNPFLGDCVKCVSLSGFLGFDYEISVMNQLEREGKSDEAETLKAKKLSWGEHKDKFIVHKGAYYLQIKVENSNNPIYTKNDESPIVFEKLSPYLSDHFLIEGVWKKKERVTSTQQDVKKQVIVRTPKLSNIKKIRMGGKEYTIDHTVPATYED